MEKRSKATWQAAGILLLVIAAFYWKITLNNQFDWMWTPDLAQQVLPWYEEEAQQFRHGSFPLWASTEWTGQPLLAQAQPGAAYPLNWIVFAWPPSRSGHIHKDVLSWYFVVIHFMAAMFLYALCRDLGRSQTASILGGLIYALTGYMGFIDWPQMINGAVWAPLVFLYLLRAISGSRRWLNATLSGCFLGIAWLSGHHQVPIFLTLASLGVWVFHFFRDGGSRWQKAVLPVLAMVTAGLVGALQILPSAEYGHLSVRWVNAPAPVHWNETVPYYVHEQYRMFVSELFGVVFPGLARAGTSFLGVCALMLAVTGLIVFWPKSPVKILAAASIAGLVFALGGKSVFHGFLYAVVPMVEKARSPVMALFLLSMGVAALAAFGIDVLREKLAGPIWGPRLIRWTAWFGVVAYALYFAALLSFKQSWEFDDRPLLTPFVALLLAALLSAWRGGHVSNRSAGVLLGMLMLLEFGNGVSWNMSRRDEPSQKTYREKIVGDTDIAQFLNTQTKPFRVEISTDRIALNWTEFNGFDALRTYTASLTTNVLEQEWMSVPTKSLLGVRYNIAEKPPAPEYQDVFTAASGLKVYQNPGTFPRAWMVHKAIRFSKPGEARSIINSRLNELRNAALTTTDVPGLDSSCDSSSETVNFRSIRPSKLELATKMSCAGMLVLSDTFYPGWTALVDGKTVKIHEVNLSMRGVPVPAGVHEVVFVYRPFSVYAGATLTLIGLMGTLGFVWIERRRTVAA